MRRRRMMVRGVLLVVISAFSFRFLVRFRGETYTLYTTEYDASKDLVADAEAGQQGIQANRSVFNTTTSHHNNTSPYDQVVFLDPNVSTVATGASLDHHTRKKNETDSDVAAEVTGENESNSRNVGFENETGTIVAAAAETVTPPTNDDYDGPPKKKTTKQTKRDTQANKENAMLEEFEVSATTVTRDGFRILVQDAHHTLQQSSIVASVDRSCEMHIRHSILPNQHDDDDDDDDDVVVDDDDDDDDDDVDDDDDDDDDVVQTTAAAAAATVVLPPTIKRKRRKKRHEQFQIRFACRAEEAASNTTVRADVGNTTTTKRFQDDVCRTANICKVILDPTVGTTRGVDTDTDATTTASLPRRHRQTKKSALLTMVNSLDYLVEHDWLFEAFLNKATYADRSDRPFFLWIGDLDQEELGTTHAQSIEHALGITYAPKDVVKGNTMHYYKPIALLIIFDMLSSSSEARTRTPGSRPNTSNRSDNNLRSDNSIVFLDADTSFSHTAFRQIDDDHHNLGPESYLTLSRQASLVGSPNPHGHIVLNSGVLVLRDTQWMQDLLVLWWHARCGQKDQLALWVYLFATWSAWTTTAETASDSDNDDDNSTRTSTTSNNKHGQQQQVDQFAYPSTIFDAYYHAFGNSYKYLRIHGHSLQSSWNALTENHERRQQQQQIHPNNSSSTNNISSSMEQVHHHRESYDYPHPANITLHNGGSSEEIGSILVSPLELPHVLLLPHWRSTIIRNATNNSSLPYLVSDSMPDTDALVIHRKNMDSCSGGRCWPNSK